MVDGSRTIRGTQAASDVGGWLDERGVSGFLATTFDGELIGFVGVTTCSAAASMIDRTRTRKVSSAPRSKLDRSEC